MSNFLTIVMIFAFWSCNKQYKQSENKNVAIVDELNNGNPDFVIQTLEPKGDERTFRETHYLASAYAQRGGVDVFSLYSILEIQLFHKKSLDWSDLSKDKNPYLKFMKTQDDVDFEARKKKRAEKWDKNLPKLKKRFKFVYDKPDKEMATLKKDGCKDIEKRYDKIDAYLKAEFDIIVVSKATVQEKWDKLYSLEIPEKWDNSCDLSIFNPLRAHYQSEIEIHELKENYMNPRSKEEGLSKVDWEMMYMNILWNTYESIPIIKKLPSLNFEQQDFITKSLNENAKLINTKEFKQSTLKELAVLSTVSILSIYKQSFDLDDVTSIQDLFCSFEPQILVDSYDLVRQRIIFIADTIQVADIDLKDLQKYKSKASELKTKLPERLNQSEIDNFLQTVEDYKLKNCFTDFALDKEDENQDYSESVDPIEQ